MELNLSTKSPVDQVRETSMSPIEEIETPMEPVNPVLDYENLIPTGSTLLNCACSDKPDGGYAKGTLVNPIGDSSAGKSLLVLTGLAEMVYQPRFDEYDLFYSDAENALAFNMGYLFGPKFEQRVRTDVTSRTIQNLYGNVMTLIDRGKPFVWVEDSLDGLTSNEEIERSKKMAKEYGTFNDEVKKKPKGKGGYKTEKARWASELLRAITKGLADTDSLVIIVSQTRDNIGFGFETKVRSGGRALKFYATHEMWLSIISRYQKEWKKLKMPVGVDTRIKVSKNKLTGKERKIDFPIYYDYGIDDIGANITFLDQVGWWTKSKQTIKAPEFDFEGTGANLAKYIRDNKIADELANIVGTAWQEKEEGVRLGWEPKYG